MVRPLSGHVLNHDVSMETLLAAIAAVILWSHRHGRHESAEVASKGILGASPTIRVKSPVFRNGLSVLQSKRRYQSYQTARVASHGSLGTNKRQVALSFYTLPLPTSSALPCLDAVPWILAAHQAPSSIMISQRQDATQPLPFSLAFPFASFLLALDSPGSKSKILGRSFP